MGFGAPAALGAKIARPDRSCVALVGDGGFGQNPALLATAFEQDIAGRLGHHEQLRVRHHRRTREGALRHDVRHACSSKDGKPYSPDFAAIARAYGVEGVKVEAAAEFKPALRARDRARSKPFVIDVVMLNEPVPTAGHWNIMDIYSPGRKVHHVSTGDAVHAD